MSTTSYFRISWKCPHVTHVSELSKALQDRKTANI